MRMTLLSPPMTLSACFSSPYRVQRHGSWLPETLPQGCDCCDSSRSCLVQP